MGIFLILFRGLCFKPHVNLKSVNGNINKVLPESSFFGKIFAYLVSLKSVMCVFLFVVGPSHVVKW